MRNKWGKSSAAPMTVMSSILNIDASPSFSMEALTELQNTWVNYLPTKTRFLHCNRVILKRKYNQMWAFHKARYETWAYDEENNKRCTNPPLKNLDKWAGLAPAYTREAQGFGRQVSQRRHKAAPDHIPRWLSSNYEHTKLLWISRSSWATWKWSSKPQMLL